MVVGVFHMERMMGGRWTAAELRGPGREYAKGARPARERPVFPAPGDEGIVNVKRGARRRVRVLGGDRRRTGLGARVLAP